MPVPELSLTLRTRGRAPAPVVAAVVREVTEADVALLASERKVEAKPLGRLRDRHHAVARLVAQGVSNADIMAMTGLCTSRISILKGDPTFKELVAHYNSVNEGAMAEFVDRATLAALTAMNNLQEKLEDDENPLPASMELEIVKTLADRIGHAPVTKVQQTNINVDLGSKLASARSRLEKARIIASLPDDSDG